jgi:hypothetical protein
MSDQESAAALTFRAFEQRDLAAVIELWEAAGWGSLDEATWNAWYDHTPHGAAIITVVEDEAGAIAGQFAMVPCEVSVSGRTVRGLRSSAVLLRSDVIFRRESSSAESGHPLLGLPAAGFELARRQGYDLVYTFPHERMLPVMRAMDRYGVAPVQLARYGCVEIDAGLALHPVGDCRLSARSIEVIAVEHVDLARRTPTALSVNCYVVRSLDWMRWRLGGHCLSEVRTDAGELAALTAVDTKTGLLSDIHVRHESYLAPALAAAATSSPTGRLKVMALPQFAAACAELGGVKTDYEFTFACWSLNEREVPSETIAPSLWLPMHAD